MTDSSAIGPQRNIATDSLKGLIAMREAEKKRLQAIIAYSRNPMERSQALGELAVVIREIKKDLDLLARFDSE
jgi:hypothetical protein